MKRLSSVAALILSASAAGAQPLVRPERPTLPAMTAADCEAPATRDPLLADPQRIIDTITAYPMALTRYSEAVAQRRQARLTAMGGWTEADKRAFGGRLFANEAFMTEAEAGFRLVGEMMRPTRIIVDERRPARERCLALLATQVAFDRMTASVELQWRIIDEMFAAEAARLGISLE